MSYPNTFSQQQSDGRAKLPYYSINHHSNIPNTNTSSSSLSSTSDSLNHNSQISSSSYTYSAPMKPLIPASQELFRPIAPASNSSSFDQQLLNLPPRVTQTSSSAASSRSENSSPKMMQHSQSHQINPKTGKPKRARRKFEEIERIYSCNYEGCSKAYGTLNHLNSHVSTQQHGQKRTPDMFKKIRNEWKERKKLERMNFVAKDLMNANSNSYCVNVNGLQSLSLGPQPTTVSDSYGYGGSFRYTMPNHQTYGMQTQLNQNYNTGINSVGQRYSNNFVSMNTPANSNNASVQSSPTSIPNYASNNSYANSTSTTTNSNVINSINNNNIISNNMVSSSSDQNTVNLAYPTPINGVDQVGGGIYNTIYSSYGFGTNN